MHRSLRPDRRFAVSDFDGCLVEEGGGAIVPEVAAIVRDLDRRLPVVVLTGRGRPGAVAQAARALDRAGLGHLPFLHRDPARHGTSDDELVAAKVAAIRGYCERTVGAPVIGIGDRATDADAYRALSMLVLHIQWPSYEPIHGPDVRSIPVNHRGGLPGVWDQIVRTVADQRAAGA